MIKTGECYWRDEDGLLWLCESFMNPDTGECSSTATLIPEN